MKSSSIDIKNRRDAIINLLEEAEQFNLSVSQIAKQLNVSEMTIRRDLSILAEMGTIQRNHGNATLNEKPYFEGETHNDPIERIKHVLAKQAATYVKPNMTIFMNTSSTALRCADFLKEIPLTIVTNNLLMSRKEMHPSSTIILSGGEIRFPKAALVGELAINAFSHINANIALIGCSAIDAMRGVTTGNFHEANINRLMIKNAQALTIVVADYRKIGASSNFIVADLKDIDILITDTFADSKAIKDIEAKGVTVIQVNPK